MTNVADTERAEQVEEKVAAVRLQLETLERIRRDREGEDRLQVVDGGRRAA